MSASLTLDEMEALARKRSANELIRIARRVDRTGGCAQPVRLRASGVDSPSFGEPDGVLLVACKTRRETRCAPCAHTYRGDARQLVRAGIEGGKGVPESVADHPAVFLTLTAPSFGAVHRAGGGPCHLGPPGRCEHGRSRFCLQRHEDRDKDVGSALCGDCYDYEAAVMFNASVGELWRRVTIYARRHLAYAMGMPERELKELVRLSYLKVAELQHRGVVHLHAVVRADSAEDELEVLHLPEHLHAIVEAAWRLGADPDLGRLRRWAHALAYSGHLMTKSRRYSTTFRKLRAARQAWRLNEAGISPRDESAPNLHWSFEGVGYKCRIDSILAATAAENRRVARHEWWDAEAAPS